MLGPIPRAVFGFAAGAAAVMTFHQGMWAALHLLSIPGLGMPPAYPMGPVPPWAVPRVVNLSFWGGLYGTGFGLLMPRMTAPPWFSGLLTGLIAVLVGFFVVPTVKGLPIAGAWNVFNWVRSILINGSWGIGLGLIASLLIGRKS